MAKCCLKPVAIWHGSNRKLIVSVSLMSSTLIPLSNSTWDKELFSHLTNVCVNCDEQHCTGNRGIDMGDTAVQRASWLARVIVTIRQLKIKLNSNNDIEKRTVTMDRHLGKLITHTLALEIDRSSVGKYLVLTQSIKSRITMCSWYSNYFHSTQTIFTKELKAGV